MDIDASDIANANRSRTRVEQRLRNQEMGEQWLHRPAHLQRASFDLLRSSPSGLEHFLRRNMACRRVEVID